MCRTPWPRYVITEVSPASLCFFSADDQKEPQEKQLLEELDYASWVSMTAFRQIEANIVKIRQTAMAICRCFHATLL